MCLVLSKACGNFATVKPNSILGSNANIFIEWRTPLDTDWNCVELHIPRNYKIFDALAGGRSGDGFLYPPRGLPNDISETVLKKACYRITDNEEDARIAKYPDRVIHRKESEGPPCAEIIRRGGTDYEYDLAICNHGHSWLTLQEIEASLLHGHISLETLDESYALVLARMRELEASGYKVRLVVWFDGGPVPSRRYKVIEHIAAALVNTWNPIGSAGLMSGCTDPVTGKVIRSDDLSKYIGPVFRILSGSKSETELINLLSKAEREDIGLAGSSIERLREVARKLLAMDVSF